MTNHDFRDFRVENLLNLVNILEISLEEALLKTYRDGTPRKRVEITASELKKGSTILFVNSDKDAYVKEPFYVTNEIPVKKSLINTSLLVEVKDKTQPTFLRKENIVPLRSQRQNEFELSANEFTANLSTFKINIMPGANLLANQPALAAFERAAAQWEAHILDPVTVNIKVDLAPLSPGILGQASSISLQTSYSNLRNAMVSDADAESDDEIVKSLPVTPSYLLPPGVSTGNNLAATKANLKALGYTNLDLLFGTQDGQITFNLNFAFDYYNTDGIEPGHFDFETVAVHEIGHILGFTSAVDQVDAGATFVIPRTFDLFRFEDDVTGIDPFNSSQFATFPRNLRPGKYASGNAIFDQINSWGNTNSEYLLSTGRNQGDGGQASHWKNNQNIGVMGPTLAPGVAVPISNADLRVLDVIGWDILEPNNDAPDPPESPDPADAPPILYFSVKNDGTVGGISVKEEDIVCFDGTDFEVFFDGSAVDESLSGLEIDAFHLLPSEENLSQEILISFTTAATINGLLLDDSDIIKFEKNLDDSYSSEIYFDGSDVGLTRGGEDIDAFSLLSNGDLLLSTRGSFSVNGASGRDEDIIKFSPTSLGSRTRGSWDIYVDGSDVGLSNNSEDIDALGLKDGKLYFSTTGNFSVPGISGEDEDVFSFAPSFVGSNTSGTYDSTLFFDGSVYGIGGNDISAIYLPS